MKQRLIGATVLGMGIAFAGAAHADSGVILYGIIDTGITYISNAGNQARFKMDAGINQNSRWGMRGAEDLGEGMQAIFDLEGGFNLNNGTASNGGALFGRRAYVGLRNPGSWGTLLLGHDYDFIYDYIGWYGNVAQFAPSYSFHLGNDIGRLAGEPVHDMVRYETPSIGGVSAGLMYGFSNAQNTFGGTAANARVYSAGLNYIPGSSKETAPYSFAAAWTKTDGGWQAGSSNGTMAQVALNAKSIQTFALAGFTKLGNFGVNSTITYTNASLIPQGTRTANAYELGLTYHFTPNVMGGVGYAWIDQHANGKYHIFSAGLDYRFSKRTDVFIFATNQRAYAGATAAGNFIVVTPFSMTPSNPNGVGASTTRNQLAAQIGLRHLF